MDLNMPSPDCLIELLNRIKSLFTHFCISGTKDLFDGGGDWDSFLVEVGTGTFFWWRWGPGPNPSDCPSYTLLIALCSFEFFFSITAQCYHSLYLVHKLHTSERRARCTFHCDTRFFFIRNTFIRNSA